MFNLFNKKNSVKKQPKATVKLSAGALSSPLPEPWSRIEKYDEYKGEFYKPPLDFDQLSELKTAHPLHEQILGLKIHLCMLNLQCKKNGSLNLNDLNKVVSDFFLFGNAYLEKIKLGNGWVLKHRNARVVRRAKTGFVKVLNNKIEAKFGEMLHLYSYTDRSAEYGLPKYLALIKPLMLSMVTIARRQAAYDNGTDGGILLTSINPEYNTNKQGELEPSEAFTTFEKQLTSKKRSKAGQVTWWNISEDDGMSMGSDMDLKKRIFYQKISPSLHEDGFEQTMAEVRNMIMDAHGVSKALFGGGEKGNASDLNKVFEVTVATLVATVQNYFIAEINQFSGTDVLDLKQKAVDLGDANDKQNK